MYVYICFCEIAKTYILAYFILHWGTKWNFISKKNIWKHSGSKFFSFQFFSQLSSYSRKIVNWSEIDVVLILW
jgi:hypothetical protein